jgi:hypothetical protein
MGVSCGTDTRQLSAIEFLQRRDGKGYIFPSAGLNRDVELGGEIDLQGKTTGVAKNVTGHKMEG